ncbi:hypothetical protein C1H46_028053 [Malus baccata]|uniref:Uncharacterized protein n=1 Tax=Malus baccata TaxID=106549 RepID=A0A540LIT5_MALBA|nr:hypothetical protein C1H46_028053 [Malus baccata]
MPRTSFAGSLTGPKVDVMIDLGNPFFNHTVDGFLKIGTVAATRVVAEDAFSAAKKGTAIDHYCSPTVWFPRNAEKMRGEFQVTILSTLISSYSYSTLSSKISCFETHPPSIVSVVLDDLAGFDRMSAVYISAELKKMCKEGAYWGTIAGVYVGAEYGIERVRGHRDWKNAMLGGALTGALVSVASHKNTNKVLVDAITGGAIATAAEFINYLT